MSFKELPIPVLAVLPLLILPRYYLNDLRYGCFDYCNTDRCNYYDPNKNLLQYYNTSICQSKWGPLECFVEESVPALNHNESKLVQCDCGVTQCLYVQLMVTIYGTLFRSSVGKHCCKLSRKNFWNSRLKAKNLQNFWDH